MQDWEPEPYELAIRDTWDRVDIYHGAEQFLRTFATVHALQRTLFAAHFCQSEVRNGGLYQFFQNPTGVLAPEAVAAFGDLGLHEAGDILTRAMLFFGSEYPRDAEVRYAMLKTVRGDSRPEWDPFHSMDTPFYASLRGPDHTDRFIEAANEFLAQKNP